MINAIEDRTHPFRYQSLPMAGKEEGVKSAILVAVDERSSCVMTEVLVGSYTVPKKSPAMAACG